MLLMKLISSKVTSSANCAVTEGAAAPSEKVANPVTSGAVIYKST